MKKVVYVVESFGAGVYTFLTELSNSIIDYYDVVIIYSLRKETPTNFENDFNPKIKFKRINMYKGLNPYKNLRALFLLKKILKNESPDVIHLHSSIAGFLGRIVCFVNRFDMDKVFYNPHGFSFLKQNESKLKRKLFYELECFTSRLGGCTVGCSPSEYEKALKISKNCVNINNGIDTKKMDQIIKENKLSISHIKNNPIKVGTVGRICYQKNPELFNNIAKSFPSHDFVWIGDGELKDKLIADNIKITGWRERKEVIKELLDVDIFILTSRWEGLSIALLEAMYLGKVVIVTNVTGNRDVVSNNINGYVANDLFEYTKAIKYITSNNSSYNPKFKENARTNIAAEYGIKKMVLKYRELYELKRKKY